jgi:hypothetical protein
MLYVQQRFSYNRISILSGQEHREKIDHTSEYGKEHIVLVTLQFKGTPPPFRGF